MSAEKQYIAVTSESRQSAANQSQAQRMPETDSQPNRADSLSPLSLASSRIFTVLALLFTAGIAVLLFHGNS